MGVSRNDPLHTNKSRSVAVKNAQCNRHGVLMQQEPQTEKRDRERVTSKMGGDKINAILHGGQDVGRKKLKSYAANKRQPAAASAAGPLQPLRPDMEPNVLTPPQGRNKNETGATPYGQEPGESLYTLRSTPEMFPSYLSPPPSPPPRAPRSKYSVTPPPPRLPPFFLSHVSYRSQPVSTRFCTITHYIRPPIALQSTCTATNFSAQTQAAPCVPCERSLPPLQREACMKRPLIFHSAARRGRGTQNKESITIPRPKTVAALLWSFSPRPV